MHDGNAAQQRRGDEAREIADDAAAERDDRRAAIDAEHDAFGAQAFVGRERLTRLAGLDLDHVPRTERCEVMTRDVAIGDHDAARRSRE